MNRDWLDRSSIEKHSLDMRQFIDFRQSTLAGGARLIDAYNSSGLSFNILPDRGLDLWRASYQGLPLSWIAPGSPHAPDYGQSWLSLFNGGLLTTCGLTHVGPPEDGRDIHGNYTRLQAQEVHQHGGWDAAEGWRSTLIGTIYESTLFSEQLSLTRRIHLPLAAPEIHMADTVRNHSDHATPFMLLYHCNLGYPLVHDGTELVVASAVYPRDARAEAGSQSWQRYEAASPLYPEQVFFHHLKHKNGQAKAALLNADFGLELSWETATLPYLTQWKNTRQGTYVCGLEPGNCIPEGQNAARESGRLVLLQPGETQSFSLTLRVLDGAEAVARCRREIEMLQREGEALPGCDLSGYRRIELQDAPETHEG